ncbi:N-formylglutamate deformylase [Xanthomonas campestris pv. campestris]|uniref:N-formylglutamate deformylase n=1 Tax=Xanthomonas campestris TaxID=339 RepID=UPI0032E3D617
MSALPDWLHVQRGNAPLLISFPHTGTDLPQSVANHFVSPWLACRDTDWWVDQLYDFAQSLGATTVRTTVSRSVIDVNRDPSGASLYPGQHTTGLCPLTTFDNQPLYRDGQAPDPAQIALRRTQWFDPYHAALADEIARLRALHPRIVVYDAHSIRSHIPHLFAGELPQFNIGSNDDASCDPALADAVEQLCRSSGSSTLRNGRFKGGWITRHYAQPDQGVHALQMELACRGYMQEPEQITPDTWPTPWQPVHAAALRAVLRHVLRACLDFAAGATPAAHR